MSISKKNRKVAREPSHSSPGAGVEGTTASVQTYELIIIGGGNSALEAAIDMVRITSHTYLVSLTPPTGDPILIDKLERNLSFFT